MSNFEFNAKPDEWLDVTSSEELLRNELDHTKNDLETKQMEILESNVTIDLLKGHKTLLENERESLRRRVESLKEEMTTTAKNLENMTAEKQSTELVLNEVRNSAKTRILDLENSLAASEKNLKTCYNQINGLEKSIQIIQKENEVKKTQADSKIGQLIAHNEKLKKEAVEAAEVQKKQASQIEKLRKSLQETQFREESLRKDLDKQTKTLEQRNSEIKEATSRIQSVSVLAQTLKEKNSTLICTISSAQQQLNENRTKLSASVRREADLKLQIVKLNEDADVAAAKHENFVKESHGKLEHAEDRIVGLESYASDLKEQFVRVSEERDNLTSLLAQKEAEKKALCDEKAHLELQLEEKAKAFAADLERAKKHFGQEEALNTQLAKQKAAFNARLKEIQEILGVTAVAEIKTELSTVGKLYAERHQVSRSCPSVKSPTLRMPLMQHQKAN